ncbi:MAG: hypothetical protein FJX75_02825 [Armatimonadetes bacterium]|nr:hypothetical protein [Armatimonadota bacterium]
MSRTNIRTDAAVAELRTRVERLEDDTVLLRSALGDLARRLEQLEGAEQAPRGRRPTSRQAVLRELERACLSIERPISLRLCPAYWPLHDSLRSLEDQRRWRAQPTTAPPGFHALKWTAYYALSAVCEAELTFEHLANAKSKPDVRRFGRTIIAALTSALDSVGHQLNIMFLAAAAIDSKLYFHTVCDKVKQPNGKWGDQKAPRQRWPALRHGRLRPPRGTPLGTACDEAVRILSSSCPRGQWCDQLRRVRNDVIHNRALHFRYEGLTPAEWYLAKPYLPPELATAHYSQDGDLPRGRCFSVPFTPLAREWIDRTAALLDALWTVFGAALTDRFP